MLLDRPERAEGVYREALEEFARGGSRHGIAFCHTGLGEICRAQGRLESALEHYSTARSEMSAVGDEVAAAYDEANIALLHAAREEWRAASAALEGCLDKARRAGDQALERSVLCILARTLGEEGRWDEVGDRLREEERLAAEEVAVDPDGPAQLEGLGAVTERAGRMALAARAWRQAASCWRSLASPAAADQAEARARRLGRDGPPAED